MPCTVCRARVPQAAIVLTRPSSNVNIAGTWVDNWGGYVTVNNNYWYTGTSYGDNYNTIHSFTSNGDNTGTIIFQTSPTAYNPNTWSKIQYHAVGTGFGYCTTAYGQASAQAAIDYEGVYDATDAAAGCGESGFSHSVATPYDMPITGSWTDNWGTSLSITNTVYTSGTTEHAIELYTATYFVYKVPTTAEYNPGTYSKIQFHTVGNGFGYCTSVYGAATAHEALTTVGVYNSSDASGGCGSSGFAHSVASPA